MVLCVTSLITGISKLSVSRARSENNLDLHHCACGCHFISISIRYGLTYRGPLTNFSQFSLKVKGASAVDRHCVFEDCLCMHLVIGESDGTPLQYSCLENPMDGGVWWAAVHGVAKSQTQLINFTFTFHFHALKKEMATHSSVLAWRIPGTGEPGGLPSMGLQRVRHDWSDLAAAAAWKDITQEHSDGRDA